MASSVITDEDRTFVETWENIASHGNVIIRLDARGDDRPELIQGRRNFMLTTAERKITSDRIVDEVNDPFLNGAFRPVRVPDSVSTKTNPNALSDEEIQSIFVSSELAWGEWMKVLDSPETLRRMMDLAEESTISLSRYRQLQQRLEVVRPRTQIRQKDREQYEAMAPGGAPDAPGGSGPSAAAAAARSRGGRSADYRNS